MFGALHSTAVEILQDLQEVTWRCEMYCVGKKRRLFSSLHLRIDWMEVEQVDGCHRGNSIRQCQGVVYLLDRYALV